MTSVSSQAEPGPVVECHSGYTYAEQPRAFEWQGRHQVVAAIAAEWQTPTARHFRVITRQSLVFELIYDFTDNRWQIYQQEHSIS